MIYANNLMKLMDIVHMYIDYRLQKAQKFHLISDILSKSHEEKHGKFEIANFYAEALNLV